MFARPLCESPDHRSTPLSNATRAFAHRLRSATEQMSALHNAGNPDRHNSKVIAQLSQDRAAGLALLELATKRLLWEPAVELASTLSSVLLLRGCWQDLQRASQCLNLAGEQNDRIDWVAAAEHNLSVAAGHMGDFAAATEHLSRCEELAQSSGDLVALQSARESYGGLLLNQGRYAEAIPLLTMCLRVWRLAGRRAYLATTLCSLGYAHLNTGDLRRAERYLVSGQQLAEAEELDHLGASFRLGLSCLYRQSGRPGQAEVECLAALTTARRVGDRHAEAAVLLELGTVRLQRETAMTAGQPLEEALVLFREMDDRVAETRALHMIAIYQRMAGHPKDSVESLEACYGLAIELGLGTEAALCLVDLAVLAADIGRVDAEEMFEAAEDIASGTGSSSLLARIQHSHGLMLLRSGRYPDAQKVLRQAWALVRQQTQSELRAAVQVTLADALMRDGQHTIAADALQSIAAGGYGTVGDGIRATANRLLAVLYSRRQLWAEADTAMESALSLARGCGDEEEELHCLTTVGNIHARRELWLDAIAAFDEASAVADRRSDIRLMLNIRANRWVATWRSEQFSSTARAISECDTLLELAEKIGMTEIRFGLLQNKGVCLVRADELDRAAAVFREAHDLAKTMTHSEHLATIKVSLARLGIQRGEKGEAGTFAQAARLLAEARHDWPTATEALKLQLCVLLDDGSISDELPLEANIPTDWKVRPEVINAFRGELELEDAQPVARSSGITKRRRIFVSDSLRTALAEIGLNVDSLVPRLEESRQWCVACGLSIAENGEASLIANSPEPGSHLIARLTHATCGRSGVVQWDGPTPPDPIRFEVECALLGPDGDTAGIVVDCYGGWLVSDDGRVVDGVLAYLRQSGFIDVPHEVEPPPIAAQPSCLSAMIVGNHLHMDGLDAISFDKVRLRFNQAWYRAANQRGALVLMFGRHLPTMTWEDPSYHRRAAEARRLVAAIAPATFRPPGRNAPCVCESDSSLKFKKCCGAPGLPHQQ